MSQKKLISVSTIFSDADKKFFADVVEVKDDSDFAEFSEQDLRKFKFLGDRRISRIKEFMETGTFSLKK